MANVFQYGSNMDKVRLVQRLGPITDLGKVDVLNHKVVFNVWSNGNNCAAADMIPVEGSKVVGRLYELEDNQLSVLDRIEGLQTYPRTEVVLSDGTQAFTYLVSDWAKDLFNREHPNALPSNKYLTHIIAGLNQIDSEVSYISDIIDEGRPTIADASIEIERTFDNPSRFPKSTIGINRTLRNRIGLEVFDFVRVEYGDNHINMQVYGSPQELDQPDMYDQNPVSISRASRNYLGMQRIGQRSTTKFKSMFNGIKVLKLEK